MEDKRVKFGEVSVNSTFTLHGMKMRKTYEGKALNVITGLSYKIGSDVFVLPTY